MDKKELEQRIKDLMTQWVNLNNAEGINKIRYAGPKLGVDEYDKMMDAIFNDWWSGGKYTIEAEQSLADFSDRNRALLFNSGSSANLILMAGAKELYFKDGDKILTLSCGFPTTVNPIIQNKLRPVFVDIDLDTLNLSPQVMEDALSQDRKIKGIFIANTLGFKSQVKELIDLSRKYNVQLFFDDCDAYGTKYHGRPIQAYGKASSLSFYAAHHATMGEGGGIVTNDDELFRIMRGLRSWGKYCESDMCCVRSSNQEAFCPTVKYTKDSELPSDYMVKYQFEWLGYNLKPLDLQAAMLPVQLRKMDYFTRCRQDNYKTLYDYFTNIDFFKTWEIDSDVSPFSFPFLLKNNTPFTRKHLIDHYTRSKIECRVLFGGNLMKHPAYANKKEYWESIGDHKNSDLTLNNFLMLGVSQILNENDMNKIIEATDNFLKQW